MTNTKFNKIWDILHKKGFVEIEDSGEKLLFCLSECCYGSNAVLKVQNGNIWNTVCVNQDKEYFRRILVD